jgi:hypothetical protein
VTKRTHLLGTSTSRGAGVPRAQLFDIGPADGLRPEKSTHGPRAARLAPAARCVVTPRGLFL